MTQDINSNEYKQLKKDFRERLKNAREFDWTGGFEQQFLENWFISKLQERDAELFKKMEGLKCKTTNKLNKQNITISKCQALLHELNSSVSAKSELGNNKENV